MKVSILLLLAACAGAASAHDAWLEPAGHNGWAVKYGDGKPEPYPESKVAALAALDAQGAALTVARTDDGGGEVRFTVQGGTPALLLLAFDNGYYSKGASGKTVNLPADRNPGAKGGSHATKYHKTVLAWSPAVARPTGQRCELVPLTAEPPAAGRPMKFRLLFEGRPLAGVKVSSGEHAEGPSTDADGVAVFTPSAGPNIVWSGVRRPVAGDARYDVDSVQINLRFDAR